MSRLRSFRPATRTFARLCASLVEEAEAIGWYEQRLAVDTDPEARGVMRDAQGDIVEHAEEVEAQVTEGGSSGANRIADDSSGSVGNGSLRGDSR
jgi:EncFtn-like